MLLIIVAVFVRVSFVYSSTPSDPAPPIPLPTTCIHPPPPDAIETVLHASRESGYRGRGWTRLCAGSRRHVMEGGEWEDESEGGRGIGGRGV